MSVNSFFSFLPVSIDFFNARYFCSHYTHFKERFVSPVKLDTNVKIFNDKLSVKTLTLALNP